MRMHRILYLLLALALLAPALASAQDMRVFSTHRGALGIQTEPIPARSINARQRVVVNVVKDSPAEKAGVQKGDTLLSINGLAASQQVMNLPFEPGDKVVLRVRRDGRERDITVVATEREPMYRSYALTIPDSIGDRVAITMDRIWAGLDTTAMPRAIYRHFGDSTATIIINGDTIRAFGGGNRTFTMHADSLLRTFRTRELPRILGDSAGFRIFTTEDGHRLQVGFGRDSTMFRPFDVLATTTMFGSRAVAGAELTPLNPGLAEYFGATDGVLVLNARDGTPAARAGLRPGDVILQVDGTAVTSIAELRRGIEQARDRDVRLRVLRKGRNVDLNLDHD